MTTTLESLISALKSSPPRTPEALSLAMSLFCELGNLDCDPILLYDDSKKSLLLKLPGHSTLHTHSWYTSPSTTLDQVILQCALSYLKSSLPNPSSPN